MADNVSIPISDVLAQLSQSEAASNEELVNRLRENITNPKTNYAPIIAWADNEFGTNFAKYYKEPMSPEESALMIAKLRGQTAVNPVEQAKLIQRERELALEQQRLNQAAQMSPYQIASLKMQEARMAAASDQELRRAEAQAFKQQESFANRQERLVKSFDSDVKKTRENLTAVGKAKQILSSGSAMEAPVASRLLARISGDVGAMSDQDVAAFGGSKALMDQFRQWVETSKTGKLTPENRAAMASILDKLEQGDIASMNKRAGEYAARNKKAHGVNEQDTYDMLMPKIVDLSKEVSKIESQGEIEVISPDGQEGTIPASQLQEALSAGYRRK